MIDNDTQRRAVLILAVAAATGWWLADVIRFRLSTHQLALLASEVACV
jgi:hypothetical protein